MPKSASTSLQKFLCRETSIRNANVEVRKKAFSLFFSGFDFRAMISRPHPLQYWHSDLFYGSSPIIKAIEQLQGDFIVKMHLGKLNEDQLKKLNSCVDHILYCRRDLGEVIRAYARGAANGVYPNLLGRSVSGSVAKHMESFLKELDDYWTQKASEIIDFSHLTTASYLSVASRKYSIENFPKERFSRGEKHKAKSQFVRTSALLAESLLGLTGLNSLYVRRFLLGLLGKY